MRLCELKLLTNVTARLALGGFDPRPRSFVQIKEKFMSEVNFVNLTPHSVNILRAGAPNLIIPASGNVARVKSTSAKTGEVRKVDIIAISYGDVEDLPAPIPNTVYIVSSMVAARLQDRPDVMSPWELVRDDAGVVIGCRGLVATQAYHEAQHAKTN